MPHRRNIDIDLLRSFASIVETGSFTRAAERQLRTQSAISLQMKRLEEQLGCRLFERGGRGVEPTDAGVLLLGYVRRILAANDELVGRMAEPAIAGTVKVSAPEDILASHLAPVLGRFLRAFSRVDAEVRCGVSTEDWYPDIVLEDSRAEDPDKVFDEQLVWVASDGGWRGQEDGDHPLPLVTDPGQGPNSPHHIAVSALDRADVRWRVALATPAREAVLAAVSAGLGVAVAPRTLVTAGLRVIGADEGLPQLPPRIVAMRVRKESGPVVGRLSEFLRDVFATSG